ncbi:MAG: MBL fold metallo-hydrolase [Bdellovibrionales bacterium]|nr:MBL fold metallo-hydrolase [Bdellovibrionales bacterium]
MSLEKGLAWSYKDLNFRGFSIAGTVTSLLFENAKILFDLGPGLPYGFNAHFYCLSHMHADHGSGLHYTLSQRSLYRLPTAKIMLPSEHVAAVDEILKKWQAIEGFQYNYKIIPAEANQRIPFNDQYDIMSFQTVHRIASRGYIIYEKNKRLKPEFQGLSRENLIEAKNSGAILEEHFHTPIVAFTGDTQIEFLESHPDIKKCKLLFMECTYLDEKKPVAAAREWGHIHLDEFIARFSEFENEHISLIHLSARYSTAQAQKILEEKLPSGWPDRISLFPRSF